MEPAGAHQSVNHQSVSYMQLNPRFPGRNVGPGLEIILKPFLLGALFRDIGTPMLPGRAQNPTKQAYAAQDLANWTAYVSSLDRKRTL